MCVSVWGATIARSRATRQKGFNANGCIFIQLKKAKRYEEKRADDKSHPEIGGEIVYKLFKLIFNVNIFV